MQLLVTNFQFLYNTYQWEPIKEALLSTIETLCGPLISSTIPREICMHISVTFPSSSIIPSIAVYKTSEALYDHFSVRNSPL